MSGASRGVRANDLKVIAKVTGDRKAQVTRSAAAQGITEAEFLRRVLDWYFEEEGAREERLRELASNVRGWTTETREALEMLFPMLELMAKVLFMRIPAVGADTLPAREAEAERLFELWQRQLVERVASGEPSAMLALIADHVRSLDAEGDLPVQPERLDH